MDVSQFVEDNQINCLIIFKIENKNFNIVFVNLSLVRQKLTIMSPPPPVWTQNTNDLIFSDQTNNRWAIIGSHKAYQKGIQPALCSGAQELRSAPSHQCSTHHLENKPFSTATIHLHSLTQTSLYLLHHTSFTSIYQCIWH